MGGPVSPKTRDTVESVCMGIVVLFMGLGFAGFKWAQDTMFYGGLLYMAYYAGKWAWMFVKRLRR